jgi:hypothetical protein
LIWSVAPGATSSDVLRGGLGALPVGPGNGDEACLANDLAEITTTDDVNPTAGSGFWYLVRGVNVCGGGPFGHQGLHGAPAAPRVSSTCP